MIRREERETFRLRRLGVAVDGPGARVRTYRRTRVRLSARVDPKTCCGGWQPGPPVPEPAPPAGVRSSSGPLPPARPLVPVPAPRLDGESSPSRLGRRRPRAAVPGRSSAAPTKVPDRSSRCGCTAASVSSASMPTVSPVEDLDVLGARAASGAQLPQHGVPGPILAARRWRGCPSRGRGRSASASPAAAVAPGARCSASTRSARRRSCGCAAGGGPAGRTDVPRAPRRAHRVAQAGRARP